MRNIACLLFVLPFTISCSTSKLHKEYKSFRKDKYLNYPGEKLLLKFNSDTTGEFINRKQNEVMVNQHFVFSRAGDDYLIIKEVDLQDVKNISFKQGDTIILAKRQLHFFYNGENKYLLSFKKK